MQSAEKPERVPLNIFLKNHAHHVIFGLIIAIALMIIMVWILLYQISSRPLPAFVAVQPNNELMQINSYDEPNLLPNTLITWASKAATAAYTFDFVEYNAQMEAVRPYFTPAGWQDYVGSVNQLIANVRANQLFVNGVVSGTPVISNQGAYPGRGYVWRIQIPFLVTYQSANTTSQQSYMVIVTLVKVPTTENPQGIGIDQFVMT